MGLTFLMVLAAGRLEAGPVVSSRIGSLEKRERARNRKGEEEIRVYFKNGFKMRSLDDSFRFQVGGRMMYDWGFFDENKNFASNIGSQENGARFRRVRFFLAGMLYKLIKFKWDIDVNGGSDGVAFKDM